MRQSLSPVRAVRACAGRAARLVLGEFLLVAILATLPGGMTGALIATPLTRWLARR